jgi:hypothetical protein
MRDARHLDHVARSLLRPAVAGKLGFSAGRSTGRSGGTFVSQLVYRDPAAVASRLAVCP